MQTDSYRSGPATASEAAHQVVLAAHCEAFRNLRLGGTS